MSWLQPGPLVSLRIQVDTGPGSGVKVTIDRCVIIDWTHSPPWSLSSVNQISPEHFTRDQEVIGSSHVERVQRWYRFQCLYLSAARGAGLSKGPNKITNDLQ